MANENIYFKNNFDRLVMNIIQICILYLQNAFPWTKKHPPWIFGCIDVDYFVIMKEYISVNNKALTLSWQRSLSYRNHPIDLFWKSMGWFHIIGNSVMQELRCSSPIILRKSFLKYYKGKIVFLSVFYFTNIHDSQDSRDGGSYLFISYLPLPLASQALRH